MSYLQLFVVALMWSFVGVMVKSASVMVSSSVITLCRFLFGSVFLLLFLRFRRQTIHLFWKDKWIWIGVAGKSCNYVFENLAITLGYAYSNVIVWPVQAVFLALTAVFLFGEKLDFQKAVAVVLYVIGVLLVSWKGAPLSEVFGTNLISTMMLIWTAHSLGFDIAGRFRDCHRG